MAIVGTGNETYLYLNGIRPRKAINLCDGIYFASAKCNPQPNEIISKLKSEVDIGVACIFLRSVCSYLHITADSPRNLAVKAWNAQWDAVLLSALLNAEIGINFQSDVIPENFSNAKELNIPNYYLKGLHSSKPKTMTMAEHSWIEKNYSNAKRLMDDEKFNNAVHCLHSYRWHSMPRVQLAVLWSGIEGLFGIDYELSFRLSLYISRFLSPNRKEAQKRIFKEIKNLYSVRSKAVHGSKIKKLGDSVSESVTVLLKLLKKCAEKNEIPQINLLAP